MFLLRLVQIGCISMIVSFAISAKIPSRRPSSTPTGSPSCRPTAYPTVTKDPTPLPSSQPTGQPSRQPSRQPTRQPSRQPSSQPTNRPTSQPLRITNKPTSKPSRNPIPRPSASPSTDPSKRPSSQPTSYAPTSTSRPTIPTISPTKRPTVLPTTSKPTVAPSNLPSSPSAKPSQRPSSLKPTYFPSSSTSSKPSIISLSPTQNPTSKPSRSPTSRITGQPTAVITNIPSKIPSTRPTNKPLLTRYPTGQPTSQPSRQPSMQPTILPTASPTISKEPTGRPTARPSSKPFTVRPTYPTSQPTSQPSRQPSSQPTRQPTTQPSSSPTALPTLKKSRRPTKSPTCLPTRNPSTPSSRPTGKPSSHPTSKPTSWPTSQPTRSFRPTSYPTGRPSSRPTQYPVTSWGRSPQPTQAYQGYNSTGSVSFDPDEEKLCHDVEIDITIKINRNVSYGSSIYITTPGITSGPCSSPENGGNISSLLVYDDSVFSVKYVEGSYLKNFIDSFMIIQIITEEFIPTKSYRLIIDRHNGLKRSCLFNATWNVEVRTNNYRLSTGRLDVNEYFPKLCFFYNSSIQFVNAYQQYPTGINISLYPAFKFDNATYFVVSLPKFTNKLSNYPLNNMNYNYSGVEDVLRYAYNATLSNLRFNTNYSWSARWVEGNDTVAPYNSSYVVLHPQGSQSDLVDIWVYIDRYGNNLIPLCGFKANYEGFRIHSVSTSELFYTNLSSIGSSNGIGLGCSHLNDCNGNGECDFCSSKCHCFDGFGSDNDKTYAISDDFARDCSSRSCPLAPARGVRAKTFQGDMHRLMECGGSGMCDRITGKCQCYDNFFGAACDNMICPGEPVCSGRGQCLSMSVLAYRSDSFPLQQNATNYDRRRVNSSSYYAWDSELSHGCLCDSSWEVGLASNQTQLAEYFGSSCQYRHCPSGDDPATTIDETDCYNTTQISGGGLGESGNLCHIDCSNRGICDYNTGICKCFPGYMGVDCGLIEKYKGQLTSEKAFWPRRASTNYSVVKF